jgi:GT2 family glycosyltransferase
MEGEKPREYTQDSAVYVILPVHDRINTTKHFIKCLKNQTHSNFHLILVDDGCSDGTPEYVLSQIQKVTVLKGNGKLWWAGALDMAHRHLARCDISDADVVLIINDDTSFRSDYLQKLVCDPALTPTSLVVSPGHCRTSGVTEYGFLIDWDEFSIRQMEHYGQPDAVTTRGLYMYFKVFKEVGGFPYRLLPHYLSDLEYTIRAKRKGFDLVISRETSIITDRVLTGSHKDESGNFIELLYNNLISKKSAYNVFYRGNFALLAAPKGHRLKVFAISYGRFYRRLRNFCRINFPRLREVWRSLRKLVRS